MSRKTKIMTLVGVGLMALLVMALGAGAFAAQDTEQVAVQVTVPATIQLALDTASIDYGTLAPPTTDTSEVIGATVNSNKAWNLYVSKNQDLTKGTDTIASSNFLFQGENAGAGVTLDVSSYAQFASGAPGTLLAHGTRGSGRTLDVRYSLTIPWDVEGDDTTPYTATHTYTATQP
ncbi:MAG: hypothetical protein V1748_06360 [Actinomycetota bacterium]